MEQLLSLWNEEAFAFTLTVMICYEIICFMWRIWHER